MAERPLTSDDLRAPVYWLLHLVWAGQDWYWATDDVVISSDDGDRVHRGGLSVDFEQVLSLFSLDPAVPSVTVGPLPLDHVPGFDLPGTIEDGHEVTGCHAELSLWVPGRTWEQRVRKLTGEAVLAGYGTTAEGLSFVVRPRGRWRDALDVGGRVQETATDASAGTNGPSIAYDNAGAEGRIVPLVFGAPGRVAPAYDEDGRRRGGSPGVPQSMVTNTALARRVLIAPHPVMSTTVELIILDAMTQAWATINTSGTDTVLPDTYTVLSGQTVTEGRDPRGRPVSYVTLSVVGPDNSFPSDAEVWVNWQDDGLGGIPSWQDPTRALSGAGEVCVEVLRRGGVAVDWGRWMAALPEMDAYRLDGYIDEPVDAWEWCSRQVLPLLPVSLAYGADGVYPVMWRADPTPEHAVAHLATVEDGGGLVRASEVRVEDGHVANVFECAFAPRSDTGAPGQRVIVTGVPQPAEVTGVYADMQARQSHGQYGTRRADTLETPYVYQAQTAIRCLRWRAAAYSHPWRLVTYDLPALADGAHLQPGDLVTITDSELGWSSRVAWVRRVRWQDGSASLDLLIMRHAGNP